MVPDKKIFTGLLELIQLYKQNPLEKFFIFTIYQNYTLALKYTQDSMRFVVSLQVQMNKFFFSPMKISREVRQLDFCQTVHKDRPTWSF